MNRKAYLKNVKTFFLPRIVFGNADTITLLFKMNSLFCFSNDYGYIIYSTYLHVLVFLLLCTYVIGVGYLLCTLCTVTIKTITIIHNQTLHSKACIVISFIVIIVILVFTISKENIVILYLFIHFHEYSLHFLCFVVSTMECYE